ncbi:molybdenum ABC transporter ATP-binding protein [Mesobacterium pallidum]|uniref:molybdenum ABC transporter ATP-binding protein n=1 Tax=Mesobacterium pallidum TaxID=2872037 RepID=UPI001EE307C6|nr:molybdenum ABC transporter ATP-binding protein [Mesobacterium pallidum]
MTLSVCLKHAFDGFTLDAAFDAPPGVTVLFGGSGSGKTTIVNAVAGLFRPDAGRAALGDEVLFDTDRRLWQPPHRRGLGYVFQDARLFPHLSVRQNLCYGRWFARGRRTESFDHIVEMLGIGPLLDRRPADLSGGERQRVAIGRALLAGPRMILADEPLAALDEPRKAEILPYFERLRDELAIPMLYVSHSASEVARLATTVVALKDGRVTRQGPAAEVLSDPQVTPIGARAAGAVIAARVAQQHPDGLSELEAGGLRLLIPRVEGAIGSAVRIHVEAQDVMLALAPPQGISALNVLPATVREIRLGGGPGALVQLRAGDNLLLARVTRRAVTALGLHAGQELFAVIEAVSVAKEGVAG